MGAVTYDPALFADVETLPLFDPGAPVQHARRVVPGLADRRWPTPPSVHSRTARRRRVGDEQERQRMSRLRFALGVTLYALAAGVTWALVGVGLVGIPVVVVAWLMGAEQ